MKKTTILIALLSCAGLVSAQDAVPSVSEVTAESDVHVVSQLVNNTPQTTQEAQIIYEAQPFGYLSYNDVMQAMPEYAQAMKSMEELRKTYDQEMVRSEQDFSKKFSEYLDGQKTFPENIMLKRQKELQLLMEQSVQFKKEAQELLTKAEDDLMTPVEARLKEAIQAVGKRRKYAYVLNTDANAYPYISGEGNAENCTDAVLIQLGIK